MVLGAMAQPPKVMRVEGGHKGGTVVDSVLFLADSLQKDSIINARLLADSLQKDSLLQVKAYNDSLRSIKFRLTKDTMKAGNHLLLSFVPGMGQIYNRQFWKAPVFVGAMAGFATGGVLMNKQYKRTEQMWRDASSIGEPSTTLNSLQRKMYSQRTLTTVMYAMAGVSYLYSVADATFNYRGEMSHIRKATTLAALFPGAGFFYTKTYWRLPIYYGGFAVTAAVIDYNNRYYQRFKTAYELVVDNDPDTVDEFGGIYSATVLKNARDAYRRNRDFGIICTAAVYLLSVIDTYVIATLKNWDISEDLSVVVEPKVFSTPNSPQQFLNPSGAGMSLRVRF